MTEAEEPLFAYSHNQNDARNLTNYHEGENQFSGITISSDAVGGTWYR
jgi:hypothetical protein